MGKGTMFMMFMWLMCCLAGSIVQGHVDLVSTSLTVALTDTGTTITVARTTGFADSGIIVVEEEQVAYSKKTSTTFTGSGASPLIRGAGGTEAVSHAAGAQVATVPGSMLGSSAAYNIAVMSDASGVIAFIAIPLAVLRLIGSFFFLPLSFLGTDLQILTYLWAIVGIGMIVVIAISLIGGRRV